MVKKAAYGLLAAFLAAGVYGAIPTTAEGWYTPSGGFPAASGTGTIYYGYDTKTGQWQTKTVTVDDKGNVTGGDVDFKHNYELMTAYQALKRALGNEAVLANHDEAIETLGKNLHALTSKDGIHIRNENTGQEFTIKFGGSIASAVSGESGDIPATSDAADPVDGSSLGWRSDGKLQVSAWDTVPSAGDTLANKLTSGTGYVNDPSRSLALVTRTASGNLRYLAIGVLSSMMTVDGKSIETNAQNEASVSGYAGAREGMVAYKTADGLEWRTPDSVAADESSITTNTTGGVVSVFGFSGADEGADGSNPSIPFANGGGSLAWQSVLDFFNTGLFELSNGKVNLKGVSAGDEDDLRVMTVSASDSGAAITSSSISTMIDTPLDMDDGKITVEGWKDATPDAGDTLAQRLTGGAGLLTRTASGGVSYMAIGSLASAPGPDGKSIVTNSTGTAIKGYGDAGLGAIAYKTADGLEWKVPEDVTSVDGSSITTNSEDGASSSGVASLYGWSGASAEDFPRRGSDGHLEWKSPGDLVDGASIAWAEVDGGKVFEVKDAHAYAGHHSRHYFGTSNDKTAALGWHELPNVTTNRVEGDGITIASTVDDQDPGLKRLGLLGWNKGWGGDPLFVVNAGGSIGYIPLPALTNLAACACSNKWTRTLEWIGDGEVGDDGLTFESEDLDHYLYGTLGYIYSTTPDNLYFDNDGEQIEASFTAPSNWADGDSVELTSEGAYQVAGWADASACAASMSAMLSSPEGSDATTHLLLAKKTDTGELHYVAIGDGVKSGAEVDDTTITTNTAHGATAQGVASIYGWSGAANDTYLSKNEGGNLEWRKVDPVPGVDDASIVTNTTKELTLRGYAAAENSAIPMKTAQGLSWLKASSATNFLLAGAGINITDNGGGAITISAQAYNDGTDTISTVSVVTDVRYDETTHKFQKKTRQIVFKGSLGTESGWTDVFEAVSHKAEHGVE